MTAATDPAGLRPRLREVLTRDELLTMPGGCSPLYAMMAEKAGFESFFLAGSQVSAFLYGLPDCGAVGLRDVVDHARHVAARTRIPVLVDADTGYGNAVNVFFAVQEFVRAGVAGVSIEDQEAPKKSATLAGRRCISVDEAVGKIRAAVAARDELDPAFVVCARTDATGSEGTTFDDALARGLAYATEGGADLLWLNSVESREQLRTACAAVPVPVLTIWGSVAPPHARGVRRARGERGPVSHDRIERRRTSSVGDAPRVSRKWRCCARGMVRAGRGEPLGARGDGRSRGHAGGPRA